MGYGSVWIKELDTALNDFIPTLVKVLGESSQVIPVKVVFRSPETEFEILEYPSVSILNYNHKFDPFRYVDIQTVRSREGSSGLIEKSAIPYTLHYQIDFWANYNEDINEMTRRWNANVAGGFVITAVDTLGNNRLCEFVQTGDAIRTEEIKQGKRIIHVIYSYKVAVELDEVDPETGYITTEVETVIKNL